MSYQDRAMRPFAQAPSPNSPSKPLPHWIVGLVAFGAFWLVESLCYLVDTWRW